MTLRIRGSFAPCPGDLERVHRDPCDTHLVRDQPEDPVDLVTAARRNGLQAQIAGVGIETRQRRKSFSRLDANCQQLGNLPHQLQGIVTVEETSNDRLVGNREQG